MPRRCSAIAIYLAALLFDCVPWAAAVAQTTGAAAAPTPAASATVNVQAAGPAYRPVLDPRVWRDDVAGPKSRVVVLGSAHLSQLPAGFKADDLALLIDKLFVFAPEIITYEGLSGEQCDNFKRYPTLYPDVFKTYCRDLADAERATGLDFAAARVEVETLLAQWPAKPTPAQRRRLVAVSFAAGDRASGMVQWMQLPADQRAAGDGVLADWLPLLNRRDGKFNETFDVAAVLAARLGLQRMVPVDDHTADDIQDKAAAGFEALLQAHWKAIDPDNPVIKEYMRRSSDLDSAQKTLDFYRFINQPRTQMAFIEADYRRALRDTSPERFGRQYVAWWETRNLRMVANIRAAFGNRPGARVLNIVGASHKAYYEAYLDLCMKSNWSMCWTCCVEPGFGAATG